jgi:hypothetical protein
MTSKRRLDRLERLAKIFIRAGRRTRTNVRELREDINILITIQNENEDRFNARFEKIEELFAKNEDRFERTQQAIDRLVAAQSRTDEKLQEMIDILRRNDLGRSFA